MNTNNHIKIKKNMRKAIYAILIIGLIGMLSACGSAKLLPADVSNRAIALEKVEDKALVYVYRTSMLGGAVAMHVDLDDVRLTTLYPKNFYLCLLDPGEYVFTGNAENKDKITVAVEAGKSYYIEIVPRMGIVMARCEMKPVDAAEGQEKVGKCKLVGLNPEAQKALNYFDR